MIRLFIGYDEREALAYHVLVDSILRRAAFPLSITPLDQGSLRRAKVYTRAINEPASTSFSFTRFLVPYLADYTGIAIYMDCDMLVRGDIIELMAYFHARQPGQSVAVVPHCYTPHARTKFDGHPQIPYPRKNWSSLMMFDCAAWKDRLTPEYITTATASDLHRFQWADDNQIAHLPLRFNWLVGEYPHNPDATILHYTNGGPWHRHVSLDPHDAQLWLDAYQTFVLPEEALSHGHAIPHEHRHRGHAGITDHSGGIGVPKSQENEWDHSRR